MHPVIISAGWFNIYSFGLMLAVSFLVGIYISAWRAKRYGVDPQIILDLSVYLILAGVLGSRLLYVLFHMDEYNSVVDIFALWQGGATLYGGFLLAIFAAAFFARKKNMDFVLIADIVSPALALGIMLTRIGCYMSGCCFGNPSTLPWAVTFPANCPAGAHAREIAAQAGGVVSLHPTQLYATLYGLIIFVFLMLFEKKLVKRGAAFGTLLMFYGVFRFGLDFFRYYEDNMKIIFDLNLNQLISVVFFLVGLYFIRRKTKLQTKAVKT